MRVSKVLGSLVAVVAGVIVLSATTESRAEGDVDLVKITCKDGELTATGVKPWHANPKAPWHWNKGKKLEVTEQDGAKFKGEKCEGMVKAFICSEGSCKGPIHVPVN